MGQPHPAIAHQSLGLHHLTGSSHSRCRSNHPEWETRCELRQDCCCQRGLFLPRRPQTVKGAAKWQMTTSEWLSVLSARERGLTSRDILLKQNKKNHHVSLEMRKKRSIFFHPSRLPIGRHHGTPKLSNLNRKLGPQFGSSCQEIFSVQSGDSSCPRS